MIKRLIIALACILPLLAEAANPSASSILSKTISKLNSAKCISADFTATSGDGESMSGKLTLAKEKFSMVGKGFGVWFNGADMWSYTSQTGEVSLSSPTSEELMEINPLDIINNYAEFYNAETMSNKDDKCGIKLTAKKKNASVSSAYVVIDTKTSLPVSIDAAFSNSATVSIIISNAKEETSVPAAASFTFPASKYPGVEVVDLR